MAHYRVAVLKIQGINKKMYVADDIVEDGNFPEGVAKELVKEGRIVPLSKKESDQKAKEDAKVKALKEAFKKAQEDHQKAQEAYDLLLGELEGADEARKESLEAEIEKAKSELDKATEQLEKLK